MRGPTVRGTENEIARLDQIDLRSVSIGEGLTIVGTLIRNRYYDDHRYSAEARACFDGFGTLDLPQAVPGYKPRPLKGVWATPPFLHNGSVPTVYALLSPREERPATFYVGTHEYNPRDLGYVTERPGATAGGFVLDTRLPGNRNTGHEFRKGYVPFDESKPPETQYQGGVIGPELTRDERYAIIGTSRWARTNRQRRRGAYRRTALRCWISDRRSGISDQGQRSADQGSGSRRRGTLIAEWR